MSSTSGARAQVARLLTLVPLLHAHGSMPLGAAAEAMGVTPEQLLGDLKVLFMVGLPGGYPEDLIDVDLDALEGPAGPNAAGMIRVSNADYLSRPLRLNPTEASALIVATRAMRAGASTETAEVIDRVLAKLEVAAASGPASVNVDPGVDEHEPALIDLASRLRDAAARRRQVRLVYYVPARDEEGERLVDPRGVDTVKGMAYLDAWCHSAEAPRLFRLDRIVSAEVLDTEAATEPEGARDLTDGFFATPSETQVATLRLAPAARWVTEYYPMLAVRSRRDGAVDVDLQVADSRWLTRLMLRLAPNAYVMSPPACAEAFTSAAQAALRLYDDPPAGTA